MMLGRPTRYGSAYAGGEEAEIAKQEKNSVRGGGMPGRRVQAREARRVGAAGATDGVPA